jgi:flavin-binding protein dodecin
MTENACTINEIVGSSKSEADDAIRGTIGLAANSRHNLDWFEVTGIGVTSKTRASAIFR